MVVHAQGLEPGISRVYETYLSVARLKSKWQAIFFFPLASPSKTTVLFEIVFESFAEKASCATYRRSRCIYEKADPDAPSFVGDRLTN